ncbi:Sphingomyelin phosphodiesterase [Entamoeba marina]
MLHLTDIHYNPLFNPIYSNNWCLPPNLQKTYYNTQSNYYGMEGCNPPITLIDAFLENAKENGPYNVIIVSGDICSHSLPNALHAECLQLVMEKIKMNFGETPNHITCSDQQFAVLYNHFNDYIPSNQEKVFKQLASYSVTIEDQLFISINTNLINKYHPNDCQLLSWLQGELELAEQNNQRAIIVGHTPPGSINI